MAIVIREPYDLDPEYNARVRALAEGERRVREAMSYENDVHASWRLSAIVNRAKRAVFGAEYWKVA